MTSAYHKKWYAANRDRVIARQRIYAKRYRKEYPERRMLSAAKNRSKLLGLVCDLEISDIIIPDVCPILGTPMIKGTRYAPSLDRIKPELGYVKGNVWVISWKANVMKNDASREELERFAHWVSQSPH